MGLSSAGPSLCWLRKEGEVEESWLPDAPRVSQTFGRMRHIQKKCNTSAVVAVRCV